MAGEESRVSLLRRLLSPRLAIALGVLAFGLNVAGLVLVASAGGTASALVRLTALLPTIAVGMLVAVRRPNNPLGWLMLGGGVLFPVQAGSVAYAVLDYRLHHGTLPLGRLAIALQATWAGGLVLIAGILWLFPDGHLPRGRWRPVGATLWAAGLLYGAVMFGPWIIAATASSVRVDATGTPLSIDHPAGNARTPPACPVPQLGPLPRPQPVPAATRSAPARAAVSAHSRAPEPAARPDRSAGRSWHALLYREAVC
jgi:hypothetical protein